MRHESHLLFMTKSNHQIKLWNYLFFIVILYFISSSCSAPDSSSKRIERKKIDSIYKKAALHINEGKDEKAFYEFNLAKDGYLNNRDSVSAARCLTEMAIIQEYASDNLGSIETSISAIKLLNENKKEHFEILFDNYCNLGVNSLSLKNYKEAEKLYLKSTAFAETDIQHLRAQHNLALLYFKRKEYKKAKETQQFVLNSIPKDNENYYKALINYSRYLWHDQQNSSPVDNYKFAEKNYVAKKDNWGLAATYCYLSEYYKYKRKDSAIHYAKKMYKVSKELKSPLDELEALNNLISLDNNPKPYFESYSKISDSLTTNLNRSKNQFATIRYESEKNLSENLKLEKDISQKNYLLVISIFLIVTTAVGSSIWIRGRKKKLRLLADNKIKEERLHTSKKIHDVVANGLYQVMTALEHNENLPKEELLDRLEDMYQKSRDLSYDRHLPTVPELIKEQISEVAKTFQNENLQVFIIGNEDHLWQ